MFVPEPIQNLGVIGASDRFEGYAAERTALLSFIVAQGIQNVVFVTADLHGTFVNNLTYSNGPGQAQIATGAFEVITGAVAFDAPLGPSLIEIGALAGLLTPAQVAFYQSLPRAGKDAFVRNLVDSAITPLGYDPLGLEGSPIDATLEAGSYVATHTYGWTEFQVDANDQSLRIITWGIDPYTDADLLNPATVTNRQPAIVQQFVVRPQGPGGTTAGHPPAARRTGHWTCSTSAIAAPLGVNWPFARLRWQRPTRSSRRPDRRRNGSTGRSAVTATSC